MLLFGDGGRLFTQIPISKHSGDTIDPIALVGTLSRELMVISDSKEVLSFLNVLLVSQSVERYPEGAGALQNLKEGFYIFFFGLTSIVGFVQRCNIA